MTNYLLQSTGTEEPSTLLVCGLGIGVVFVGLALLVGIVSLMNAFFRNNKDTQNTPTIPASPASHVVSQSTPIENKQELIAAVCTAIAEENGTDISAIRVVSFKKL